MSGKTILALAGSARADSVNKKLAAAAAKAIEAAGARAVLVDLADHDAPVYNGDLEARDGIPDTMVALKRLVARHDGLFIASPEYNGFVPPLLVNAFSWVSRPEGGESAGAALAGKMAAIGAASPGRLGGVRVIPRLRDYLGELGVTVLPGFVTVPGAAGAFDATGAPGNDTLRASLDDLARRLVAAV